MLVAPPRLALIIAAWFVLQVVSKSSEFAAVASTIEVGCLYYGGFLKVLNLRMLAPPSRLALIIGAWFVLQGISKSSE